jgi:hypothetical protein
MICEAYYAVSLGVIPHLSFETILWLWYMCFVFGVCFYFRIATYLVLLLLVDFYFSCGYDVDHITPEWG